MLSSFSANRQGRPRPSNITFGRRRSDDKSMPSPSFNSTMSLSNAEDVFCDRRGSVDRLRHHYLAMPATPSSLSGGSSPGTRMERLPSLGDLFHRDILSPPGSAYLQPNSDKIGYGSESMQRTDSVSSASSSRGRRWNLQFSHEGQTDSIGPPATPLSPFFAAPSEMPLMSPRAISPDRSSCIDQGSTVGERTPKAAALPSFDFPTHSNSNKSSPRCPDAPLIGAQSRGHFESQDWQQQHSGSSLGSFHASQRRESYNTGKAAQLSEEALRKEKAVMSRLIANLPRAPGLSGLGLYMDEDNVQPPIPEAVRVTADHTDLPQTSPPARRAAMSKHTGLTPMVEASQVFDTAFTPTRSKTKKPSGPLKTWSPKDARSAENKTSPSSTVSRKGNEAYKTPLNKSRPMFRFDTGSGKKSSKPKGHKMSPDSSPWGVFGAKDGWKPLAAPNVSRAIAEANKLVYETAAQISPPVKRHGRDASAAASPSKRLRPTSAPGQTTPYKENVAPSSQTTSSSSRIQAFSPSFRNSSTALPLSTVR